MLFHAAAGATEGKAERERRLRRSATWKRRDKWAAVSLNRNGRSRSTRPLRVQALSGARTLIETHAGAHARTGINSCTVMQRVRPGQTRQQIQCADFIRAGNKASAPSLNSLFPKPASRTSCNLFPLAPVPFATRTARTRAAALLPAPTKVRAQTHKRALSCLTTHLITRPRSRHPAGVAGSAGGGAQSRRMAARESSQFGAHANSEFAIAR